MITVKQAKKLKFGNIIYEKGQYNADGTARRYKVNGKVQLWKTRPNDFKIPVKRGLYGFGYVVPSNAEWFMLSEPTSLKRSKKR